MQQSVVRRSLWVTAIFIGGHLFHFALLWLANRLLDPGVFGRLYTAMSLLNVLLTPATALSFVLAQHFSRVCAGGGRVAVVAELQVLFRRHFGGGLILVILCSALFILLGSLIGADAFLLLVLVPAVAFSFYLFEMGRAALQGMLAFAAYSIAWIGWRAGQFVLGLLAILLIGTAWSVLGGMLAATSLATVLLILLATRRYGANSPMETASAASPPPFRVMSAAPFAVQYGLLVLTNNIDVLLAYFVLSKAELGAYAASSFLPKAIVTATLPVSQVMLPVMSQVAGDKLRHVAIGKSLALCAVLGVAPTAVFWLAGELVCDARFGVRFCSPTLLTILALAAIPLGMLRVLVIAGLQLPARGAIILSACALAGTALIILSSVSSPRDLAVAYAASTWTFLLIYGAAAMVRR